MQFPIKAWQPISISRGGQKITHLGFADDLFIFAKASMSQVEVINERLNIFCASSGQKISHEKMEIYFSKNVGHVRANEMASAFGFSLTNDLDKDLGICSHHSRVNANSFSYVTERLM